MKGRGLTASDRSKAICAHWLGGRGHRGLKNSSRLFGQTLRVSVSWSQPASLLSTYDFPSCVCYSTKSGSCCPQRAPSVLNLSVAPPTLSLHPPPLHCLHRCSLGHFTGIHRPSSNFSKCLVICLSSTLHPLPAPLLGHLRILVTQDPKLSHEMASSPALRRFVQHGRRGKPRICG